MHYFPAIFIKIDKNQICALTAAAVAVAVCLFFLYFAVYKYVCVRSAQVISFKFKDL